MEEILETACNQPCPSCRWENLQVGDLLQPHFIDIMRLLHTMPNAPLTHPQMTYSTCHSLKGVARGTVMISDPTAFAICPGPKARQLGKLGSWV